MSETNTEKSKTPYIIGVIILVVAGWWIWGQNSCTLECADDATCEASTVEGCAGYVELSEDEVAAAAKAAEEAAAAKAAEEAAAAKAAEEAAAAAGN